MAPTDKEISCRVTRTLLMYVREQNDGSLGTLLQGLELDEDYLLDTNNWVSHDFLHILYRSMVSLLNDENSVYKFALASGRLGSLGLLDSIARLAGSPKLLYSQAPRFNKLLKLNGSDTVFRPAQVGGILLKNSTIRSATHEGMAEADGSPTEQLLHHTSPPSSK